MVPHSKPDLGREESVALWRCWSDPVDRFEAEFARVFEAGYALASSHGCGLLSSCRSR
jgi:hypothetical protein